MVQTTNQFHIFSSPFFSKSDSAFVPKRHLLLISSSPQLGSALTELHLWVLATAKRGKFGAGWL